MSLFDLKLMLSRSSLLENYFSPEHTFRIDEKIAERYSSFNEEIEKIRQLRRQNRSDIEKIKYLMRKTTTAELPKVTNASMREIRKYEKALKRQIKDILSMISLLKKVIENEDLELIYDLKTPLKAFEAFVKQLRTITIGIEVKKIIGKKIQAIFKEIESAYDQLLNHTFYLIENDLRYYKSIGLQFHLFDESRETDYAFVTHVKKRAKLKKQINGKVQWILLQIQKLEETIQALTKDGTLTKDQGLLFLQSITYFKNQFQELIDFCLKRLDVANHMIIEAIVLQKEKYEELENLRRELHGFYEQFLRDQQQLMEATQSEWKRYQITKRINEFKAYQEEMKKEFSSFEKAFTLKINEIEKDDLKELQIEEKELKKVKSSFPRFKSAFKKTVLAGLLLFTVTGASLGTAAAVSPKAQEQIVVTGIHLYSKTTSFLINLLSVREDFAKKYDKENIKWKIVDSAIKHLRDEKYIGTNAPEWIKKYPIILKSFKETNCIQFVNDVLSYADKSYHPMDRMDKVIAYYKKKGWQVYFVTKDPSDKSEYLNARAEDFMRRAKNGTYPYIKKINHFIVGEEEVAKFQEDLKGKVALVSFNTGVHSALILNGKVVQAHWNAVGGRTIEGMHSFKAHLSSSEKGIWEFAVVAVAP